MAERILYLMYLISWHKERFGKKGFKSSEPACFAEWQDCELHEMISHPDWYSLAPFVGFLVECAAEKRSRHV